MRILDYWCGVPLCFFLSISNSIYKALFFRKKQAGAVKKIAFIKLSELGAIILAYPLLKRIKEEYPQAELFFVTFKKNRDVFTLLGNVVPRGNILTINEESLPLFIFDTLKAIRRLRRERVDFIFDLEFFSRFSSILTCASGAGKSIGFYRYTFEGLYRGNFLTHRVQYNPFHHIAGTYLSLAGIIREDRKDAPESKEAIDEKSIALPGYVSGEERRSALIAKLKELGVDGGGKFFLLNPGEGALPSREWPLENFIALSQRLLERNSNYVILVGTEGAARKAEMLLKSVGDPRCVSLVGNTSLEELMELFCISRALISNDCGLVHLAMLTAIEKFIIFGPETPQVFGPLGENNRIFYANWPCSPCLSAFNHRNSACVNNLCLQEIKPADVYAAIQKSLLQEKR